MATFTYTGANITASAGTTGTGLAVAQTNPTFITPTLGVASATSITFSTTSGVIGTTTNNAAAAGSVGELVSAGGIASPVTLTTGTSANVTSLPLTAGDWDIWGNLYILPAATTNITIAQGGLNTVSATLPSSVSIGIVNYGTAGAVPGASGFNFSVPQYRLSLSGAATLYLVASVTFTVSTCQAGGSLYARRRR